MSWAEVKTIIRQYCFIILVDYVTVITHRCKYRSRVETTCARIYDPQPFSFSRPSSLSPTHRSFIVIYIYVHMCACVCTYRRHLVLLIKVTAPPPVVRNQISAGQNYCFYFSNNISENILFKTHTIDKSLYRCGCNRLGLE